MVEKELTLPLLDQTCASVLSNTVRIQDSGATHGAKIWSCASKEVNSKLIMVMLPCGANCETSHLGILAEKGERHMKHWTVRAR